MYFILHLQVKQEKLAGYKISNDEVILGADVIRSEYRLTTPTRSAMQQREILSESTVSINLLLPFLDSEHKLTISI